eukprot:TRINITY_DN17210_c0_g1_i1.p1 TRINITY_DN17210_c0_g1~~TRINITY_DN17210_c0_g1_i1.p1  ORF type:complete len:329 (+),score=80.44 TRINITY_DN17210_c0_g1_i1:45-989(+)
MAAGGMLSAVLCLTAAGCRSLLCNGVDSLVERGDLLSARRTAALGAAEEGCMEHCAGRWRRGIESLRRHPDWRDRVRDAHREAAAPPPLASVRRCWGPVRGEWHRRCSSSSAAAARAAAECCAVGNGSWSYLALPAVRETEVLVQLPSSALLRIQQDGVLRLFASDGVLWPAGFLLALWLSSRCWRWAGREILELGAGTGVASIAAALCGARVTAADKEFTSAATTLANAAAAGAESVAVLQYDWSTDQALPRRSYPATRCGRVRAGARWWSVPRSCSKGGRGGCGGCFGTSPTGGGLWCWCTLPATSARRTTS